MVTWGDAKNGGDSTAVQARLKKVQHIQSCAYAFAAILGDGSVVTWGDTQRGGDSSAVQDQLKNVQQIQASSTAFAAILGDESIVAWGRAAGGGYSPAVNNGYSPSANSGYSPALKPETLKPLEWLSKPKLRPEAGVSSRCSSSCSDCSNSRRHRGSLL